MSGLWGCPDPVGDKLTAGPEALTTRPGTEAPGARKNARFIRIRDLLRAGSEDPRRATQLYDLVHPVCVDEAARQDFLEVARWSASFSDKDNRHTAILVLDTLEYVATACFRTDAPATLSLLARAEAFLPNEPRLAILRARLYATDGRLTDALAQAEVAAKAGSVHALALKANILARMARSETVGYRAGMLETAIAAVSVDPQAHWLAIDLTAVLSTKARLLSERATWEDAETAKKTIAEADALFERLSVPPFLMQTRLRALDNLCFDAVVTERDREPCRRAADNGVLGAAVAAGLPLDPTKLDGDRLRRIEAAQQTWTVLPKGAVVLVVARGDEAELLEWTRPTARLMHALVGARPDLRVVLVDRTRGSRAGRLVERLVSLAGVEPRERLRVGREPLAMPCIAAVLAQRQVPAACPLDKPVIERLEKMTPYGTALVVGRDLDGELAELALYEMDATLLSFRLSRLKKPVHAWLKSVSDTFLLAP